MTKIGGKEQLEIILYSWGAMFLGKRHQMKRDAGNNWRKYIFSKEVLWLQVNKTSNSTSKVKENPFFLETNASLISELCITIFSLGEACLEALEQLLKLFCLALDDLL